MRFSPPDRSTRLRPWHLCCAAAALLPLSASAAQTAAQPTSERQARQLDDLSGLWVAKRRFGPDARGTLIIARRGTGLYADFAGQRLPVTSSAGELAFALPGDRGSFSGRFEGKNLIRGLWTRPGTAPSGGKIVVPVRLRADAARRWVGQVEPPQDEFTFYLFVKPRADGSYEVVLRNPEFDLGNQQNVRSLVRDGDRLRLIGRRGDSDRVVMEGKVNADLNGFSLVSPGRGGTYDFQREGQASFVYPRPRPTAPYRYEAPAAVGDGWPTTSLAAERIDQQAMERLVQSIIDMRMDEADAPEIHALLIARHGRLVLEEYFHGFTREKLHTLRSAGKSLAGTAIGAAMHAGAPLQLDSRVYQVMNGGIFPPDLDPRKRAMTLEHLLTMSSGHYCDDTDPKAPGNEDYIGDELQPPDVISYFMSVPMITEPGENSVYCSMQPHLALAMLAEATRESPVQIFDRLVAQPMQIATYAWPLDPAGRPYGGGGVAIRARDFMKFGQLMLNGGTWSGKRILDSSYAKAAVAKQYHLRNVFYGYLWWMEHYPYKTRQVLGYSARGAGGNLVFVVPELDLVVTTMAGNYSNRRGMRYLGNLIANAILPAVREAGDDPNAPVKDLDWISPYGRSTDGSRVSRR